MATHEHNKTVKQTKKQQLLPSWVMPVRPGVEPPFCKHWCWTMLLTAASNGDLRLPVRWFIVTRTHTHTHKRNIYIHWNNFVTCLPWSMSSESCEKFSLPLQLSKLQWKWKLFATVGTHILQRYQRSYLLFICLFLNSWPYWCFPTPVLYNWETSIRSGVRINVSARRSYLLHHSWLLNFFLMFPNTSTVQFWC